MESSHAMGSYLAPIPSQKNAAAQKPLKQLQDVVRAVYEHFKSYVDIHGESCFKTFSTQHCLPPENPQCSSQLSPQHL
jgi:hypothetical protein